MAVSYTFYTNTYLGNSISAADRPALEARAEDRLKKYKRWYQVTAPEANSEAMAICAMADAYNYFDAAANGLVYTSSSIGSVSSSRGGVASVDTSASGQAKELYRCAQEYLDIYRGTSNVATE